MKKIISLLLCTLILMSAGAVSFGVSAKVPDNAPDYIKEDMLYVHAVDDISETESWHHWQNSDAYIGYDEEDMEELGLKPGGGISDEKYFFLPSSVSDNSVIVMNTFSKDAVIGGITVPAGGTASVTYTANTPCTVTIGSESYELIFMHSTAEASIFVNNTDADGNGTDLYSYLCEDKENDAKATGAIVDDEGNVDNTPIKKIKGRGNTTWLKTKKPFNINYDSAVSVDGMEKTKKLSLLANYQDASLVRNRLLQDLSDAVGMPYASDSRFVDLYMNGTYLGSYQLTQKVDIGKNNLVPEIDDDTHLNDDGTLKDEFPFICEVDASAGDSDYWVQTSSAKCKLTLKGPEIDEGDPYYDEVLDIAKVKFDNMYNAIRQNSSNMQELVDLDSLTKIMLINELGKNWDVGVSSLYFVYKQAEDGTWKFFASPVWDYDNSLGNATGVVRDLQNMGVEDYEEPTGWWVQYKPGARPSNKSSKYTILGWAARNSTVMYNAAQVWFNDFVPALETFNSTGINSGEIYSRDVYYNILEGTAAMNYGMGWQLNTGSWICDHSNLLTGTFDPQSGTYVQATKSTTYDISTFKGEYDYTIDWLNSRAAWLSAQFIADYEPGLTEKDAIIGDTDLNLQVNVKDATLIQKYLVDLDTIEDLGMRCADVNKDEKVNITDATAIQKFLADIDKSYPINEKLVK
ncbi:MAG: CotH kinase family protein [Ruminococcus sp.]|nr:CotH kinase family protein [Ruminococcus sp.]